MAGMIKIALLFFAESQLITFSYYLLGREIYCYYYGFVVCISLPVQQYICNRTWSDIVWSCHHCVNVKLFAFMRGCQCVWNDLLPLELLAKRSFIYLYGLDGLMFSIFVCCWRLNSLRADVLHRTYSTRFRLAGPPMNEADSEPHFW